MAAPFFIVGCPRSGTGLLRNLLRSHPNLTAPYESHFIPGFYKAYGDPHNEREACRLAARILNLRWVRRWNPDLSPEAFADCRSFREVVCRLYENYAKKEGKPRWGDKTPQYVTEIPTLLRIFPDARIIHIYRDGRDVALSWLQRRFEARNVYTVARLWKVRVRAGRRDGEALPAGAYLELRYETLLEQPEQTMRRVCEFLGEPYCDDVLRLNPIRRKAARPDKEPFRAGIVTANAGKWKNEMSPFNRRLFESVAGDLLETLGYELEGDVRRITLPERLFWGLHNHLLLVMRRLGHEGRRRYFSTLLQFKWAELRSRLTWRTSDR
jgi:hypothetical protein